MTEAGRAEARRLAAEAVAAGEPLAWFERLYRQAAAGTSSIPWANLVPNPHMLRWATPQRLAGAGPRRALVVGCGLGDDAEALAGMGFAVTAFDIAPSAIAACRERFPATAVDYVAADLLEPPPSWSGAFDLVFEANTVQTLPAGPLRTAAIARLPTFVAPGGRLVMIARARGDTDPQGDMPWPLTESEVRASAGEDLVVESLEEFLDDEQPPVRRFLATFARSG